jgi:hypothetical protein
MAYISSERVKEIRTTLKSQFPKVKFSIRREHGSGVRISVLSSEVNFGADYKQVNEYYINEHYSGEQAKLLSKIYEVASEGTTYRETGDYGTQPSHYVWITIGEWNKPYQVIN